MHQRGGLPLQNRYFVKYEKQAFTLVSFLKRTQQPYFRSFTKVSVKVKERLSSITFLFSIAGTDRYENLFCYLAFAMGYCSKLPDLS